MRRCFRQFLQLDFPTQPLGMILRDAIAGVFTEKIGNPDQGCCRVLAPDRRIDGIPALAEGWLGGAIASALAAQFVNRECLGKSLGLYLIDAAKNEAGFGPCLDVGACKDLRAVVLVQAFQPGGQIDGCASAV